ncbi:methylated-DNA--[protein]-cysteine S-methyltransferase [Streptomyces sp. MspMP-M5]|uniref:methylated-DNA--[protein]-cysteine S-methyltransferase n=1 Tax=unclassified Streptomyces TaxID=2593676 RepID=UPI0003791F0D|nr:methylated-DNA--[protein]-cysteine S-methyltransferase [Streptomyces sp. MspMP-M5]MYT27949.1 methylated-DNA--[protein]-cysteine S-methyltransferase [Streptomyces sp. SID8354]
MTNAEHGPESAPAPDAAPEAARPTRRDWAWRRIDTPIGPLLLAATGEGLVQVVFHAGERVTRRALARLEGAFGGPPVPETPHLATAAAELSRYFSGELRSFTVPLDWSLSGGFNARVLHALADDVPYGSVVGYQDLADRVGEPGAARAVGAAMGSNPLPVVVPCHRVVASDGGIGGFGGGLEAKRLLLALEGVLPAPLF